MKLFALLFVLTIVATAHAQLAIINDPDGFVNVRKDKSLNSKIVGKIYDGQPFAVLSEVMKDKWLEISFDRENSIEYLAAKQRSKSTNTNIISGYIYNDRVMPIAKLPHIGNVIKKRPLANKKLTLNNDSITFSITTKAFDVKEHLIKKKEGWIYTIDGKIPRGVDGDMPRVEIVNIALTINGQIVSIPLSAYSDLYQPGLESLDIYFDKKGSIYIYMPGNSDGAGGYEIVWVIKDGKLVQRYFDNSWA